MSSNNAVIDGVHQVCVVVRDMESALAEYSRRMGIGPWRVFRFAPPGFIRPEPDYWYPKKPEG